MAASGLTWVRIGEFAMVTAGTRAGQDGLRLAGTARSTFLGRAGLKVVLGTPTGHASALDVGPPFPTCWPSMQRVAPGSSDHGGNYCFSHRGNIWRSASEIGDVAGGTLRRAEPRMWAALADRTMNMGATIRSSVIPTPRRVRIPSTGWRSVTKALTR